MHSYYWRVSSPPSQAGAVAARLERSHDTARPISHPITRQRIPIPRFGSRSSTSSPLSDRATIAAIAREDEDPRVRRAAVAKLMVPCRACRDCPRRSRRQRPRRGRRHAAGSSRSKRSRMPAKPRASRRSKRSPIRASSARLPRAPPAKPWRFARCRGIEDAHLLGSVARHGVVETVRRPGARRLPPA